MLRIALACGGTLLAAGQAMACYTVYGPGDRVLYQGEQAPVDMALPAGQALAARGWPGAHLVFGRQACSASVAAAAPYAQPLQTVATSLGEPDTRIMGAAPSAASAQRARARAAAQDRALQSALAVPATPRAAASPLLTDRATAERMGLPHRVLGGGVALVPARAAAQVDTPRFTLVEAMPPETVAAVLATGPDTRAMGAPPAGLPLVASRAPASVSPGTVITELRNPPVTVTQRGAATIVERQPR